MDDAKDEARPELVTFSCKEAYVYKAPPASTVGHRAEVWDVDNPMQVRKDTELHDDCNVTVER